MVYTWSFAAGKPSFRCQLTENDTVYENVIPVLFNQSQPDEIYCKTNMKISVKECQRCYIKTATDVQACQQFVFDRKYYQYTLVEEVSIFVLLRKRIFDRLSLQWTMVCDRTVFRSAVQNIFFIGYMVGSIFFGIVADK